MGTLGYIMFIFWMHIVSSFRFTLMCTPLTLSRKRGRTAKWAEGAGRKGWKQNGAERKRLATMCCFRSRGLSQVNINSIAIDLLD